MTEDRDYWAPHVTVTAVIFEEGRFLMVEERAQGRVVLNQPSGHLDPGESIIEAVKREVLEETRRVFHPTSLLGQYLWQRPGGETFMRTVIVGEAGPEDESRSYDESIIATHWLSRDELVARSEELRSPLVLAAVEDFLEDRRYPLTALRHLR